LKLIKVDNFFLMDESWYKLVEVSTSWLK